MTGDSFKYIGACEPRALRWETGIVWLESPETFSYVRESAYLLPSRSRQPGQHRVPYRMVAYATLSADAKSDLPSMFLRRVWWVATHDPYKGGGCPAEAVDPCRICPGEFSRNPKIARAQEEGVTL